jgi:hypothetical protein
LSLLSLHLSVSQQIPTERPYKLHNPQLHQMQHFIPFGHSLLYIVYNFIDILRSYWTIN